MLISIITINYNDKNGLENTIKSVVEQNFRGFEHIIIDGNSNDGSKGVIERYKNNFSYWVSEPDTGVYNAMNKGIKASKGNYLFFLNSGDVFNREEVLSTVKKNMTNNLDIYYGDITILNDKKEEQLRVHPKDLSFGFFFHKTIAHQAAFIKKSLFDKVFYYNENLKIVSDWEFFICAIVLHNASYKHIDVIVSKYDDAFGISSKPENKKLRLNERRAVFKKHFPLFYDDYVEMKKIRATLNSHLIQQVLKVKQSYFAKKILMYILNVLLFFVKKNNKES